MYFLTSIKHIDDVNATKFPGITESRCWGFYEQREVALTSVISNDGDIHKDYYNWAVVEDIHTGMHLHVNNAEWFRWDGGLEQWVHQGCPSWAHHISIWAIG